MRQSGVHLEGEAVGRLQRRRELRVTCVKPIYVRPFAQSIDEKFLFSRLLDCSPHGVCVLAPTRMQPRDQFLLKLRFERLMLVLYTVRNCTEADYVNFRIGAEFTEIVGVSPLNAAQVVFESLQEMPDRIIRRTGIQNAP
ncbi:MAG TPA: PilZ domain-containing protein [Tepidisphaeraceae bacterium]|jgi:hypothetical protein|nr:PilZ domain-containing protein [Tepidisphaeraceae bacterium]